MTDSASPTSILANAGYMLVSNRTYDSWRAYLSDWVHSEPQIRKCSHCPEQYTEEDMVYVESDGQWICWECVKLLAEERLREDIDE